MGLDTSHSNLNRKANIATRNIVTWMLCHPPDITTTKHLYLKGPTKSIVSPFAYSIYSSNSYLLFGFIVAKSFYTQHIYTSYYITKPAEKLSFRAQPYAVPFLFGDPYGRNRTRFAKANSCKLQDVYIKIKIHFSNLWASFLRNERQKRKGTALQYLFFLVTRTGIEPMFPA